MSLNLHSAFKVALILLILVTQAQCTDNLFLVLKRDSDESLLFEAKKKMNDQDWDAALEQFEGMSTDFLALRTTKIEHAKAYAGKCGLNLFELLTDLGGASSFLAILTSAFRGSTVANATACINAEAKIQEISVSAALRTGDENLVMAFVSFAKIGAILASRADVNGDGTLNWVHNDACTVGNGVTNFMTSTEARHIATGFSNALAGLTFAGSTIGGAQATDLDAVCDAVALVNPAYDFCSTFVTSGITANMELGIRAIVQEASSGIGLGTCTTGTFSIAECVCP
jgi:hypothetical protein